MAIEIELKLTIDPTHVAHFRHHAVLESMALGKPRRHKLHNIYFDTPDQDLQRAGIALRLRRMNGKWMQTVKIDGNVGAGLHQRNEWEWPVRGEEPELVPIVALNLKLLTPKLLARLRPLFVTDYWRTVWQLRTAQGAEIELLLDQGEVRAGDARQFISEIELELKMGEAASLFEVALVVQEHVPFWIENRSKVQRGYMLCSGETPPPRKTQHVTLAQDMPVAEAFQRIARECLSQLQENVVELEQDPEYLHQARVAVRRLHAVLGVFEAAFPDARSHAVEELRWLMGCLGPARDWDVFVTQTLPQIAEYLPDNRALVRLQTGAAKMRDTCRQTALDAVLSQRYTRLVLTLGLQLARQAELPRVPAVLGELATQTLSRQHKCVRRKGRSHAALNTAERHVLRIAAKKLRYEAEFFSVIYPHKRAYRYIEALAALQDVLGALNDASVTQRLLADLSAKHGQAANIVIGWAACSNGVYLQKLRHAWRNFMRQKVFWK